MDAMVSENESSAFVEEKPKRVDADSVETSIEAGDPNVQAMQFVKAVEMADKLIQTRISKISDSCDSVMAQTAESMETVVNTVLDSAEVANKSASVANSSSQNLLKTATKLNEAVEKNTKITTIVMAVGGTLLLAASLIFAFMTASLVSTTETTEEMVFAVGKSVVTLNSGIEEFDKINGTIDTLRDTQETFRDAQVALTDRIDALSGLLQTLASEVPAKTAESVGVQSQVFTKRVIGVESLLKEQQDMVEELALATEDTSSQVESLRRQLADVNELNRDVEALITLEKERYYDLLRTQVVTGSGPEAEQIIPKVRFPNPDAALPLPKDELN